MKSWFQPLMETHMPEQANQYSSLDLGSFESKELDDFFESLRLLEKVPTSYLLPDEKLLPMESVYVFQLDEAWVDCMIDGAMSVGRNCSKDSLHDQAALGSLCNSANAAGRMGFLLRTDILQGWPGLAVECFFEDSPAPIQHIEKREGNLLLCITLGPFDEIVLTQPAEGIHFGFKGDKKGNVYQQLKSLHKERFCKDTHRTEPLCLRPKAPAGVVNIAAMADNIQSNLEAGGDQGEHFSSLEFAAEMLEMQEVLAISIQWEANA